MAFALVSPPHLSFLPGWVLAAVEGVLLLALIVGDPVASIARRHGCIGRRSRWSPCSSSAPSPRRRCSSTTSSSARRATSQAGPLLLAGAKVWLGNNVAFALLYWEFDGGGPADRVHGTAAHPDLAFPQLTEPRARAAGLATALHRLPVRRLHTANAFSPTDTMPMVSWTKLAMGTRRSSRSP